jgi:hypothetical protein
MSVDDFFATPTAPGSRFAAGGTAAPAAVVPARPATKPRSLLLPVIGGAVALLTLLVALTVWLWPHSSGPGRPDPGVARLFGQQTRAQLPQPVGSGDCAAAVRAFPAIAKDTRARAAFVDGCLHP